LHPVLTRTTQISIISNLVDKARVVIYGAIDPRTYPVLGRVEDKKGKAVGGDVKISLGQMGETKTDKHGRFQMELPVGEYVVIPTKGGYTFDRESISMQLSGMGYRMEFTASPAP
jgi:hypothetical protein